MEMILLQSQFLVGIDYVVVVVYLLLMLGYGYYLSFITKKRQQENLFLAGKTLTWSSIGLNMWGTNVGPSMLIASASAGFTTGIVAGNFAWYAFVFILLLAFVFAPRYLGANVQTLPEYMGKRFGESTRTILAWYTLVVTLISWLSLTLFAGGILVQQLLNIPMLGAIVLMVVVSAFFAAAGGLKAIAYTNAFQMILLIAVSLLLVIIGINKAGGLSTIYANTPIEFWNLFRPMNDQTYPWLAIVLGYPIMGVWFWCTDQSMVQSVLGAKNLKEGQKGANFIGWLKILDVPLFILPGIICLVLFPTLTNPDEAYLTMVTYLFPTGLRGLIIVVLIAALISTIGSALNSLSTVFTIDIYGKRHDLKQNPKKIVRTGRVVVIVGAVISIFVTLAINSIKGLNLFDIFQSILGFIAPPMSVVFLAGVLWKKTSAKAVNTILIFGTLISIGVGVLYLWVFPNTAYNWPHFLLLSFYIFVFLMALLILISWVDSAPRIDVGSQLRKEKPSSGVKWMWLILVVVMVLLYIYFNGH